MMFAYVEPKKVTVKDILNENKASFNVIIDEILDDVVISFTSVVLKQYDGTKKLSSTSDTTIEVDNTSTDFPIEDFDKIKETYSEQLKLFITVVKVYVTIEEYLICNNVICHK